MTISKQATVAEARKELFDRAAKKAQKCPCCDKTVKVYRRKLNNLMALTLIYTYPLFVANPGKYLELYKYCVKEHDFHPGDYGKLVWWGLLEKKPHDPDSPKKSEGLYRLTDKGKQFTEDRLLVPSHAIEYRSEVIRFDGDAITIRDALGEKFDYEELMQEAGGAVPA